MTEGAITLEEWPTRFSNICSVTGCSDGYRIGRDEPHQGRYFFLRQPGKLRHAALACADEVFNLRGGKFTVNVKQRRKSRGDALALLSMADSTVLRIGLCSDRSLMEVCLGRAV